MTVKVTHTFKASFDELYRCLTNEDFLRKKYESVGSRNVEIKECGQDDDVFRIEWTREVPSNPPGFAKKVLSEWNRLEEIMEWSLEDDGSAHANYLCKVSSVPGDLQGEFDLRAVGDGCEEAIVMQANIKIPLLGRKIAGFVEEDAHTNLVKEYAFTQQHLGEA